MFYKCRKHVFSIIFALIIVLLALPVEVRAEENVTPVNIEPVLLEEDFSNESEGWSTNDTNAWSVGDGKLTASFPVGGENALTNSLIVYSTSEAENWNGYHVSTEFTLHKYDYTDDTIAYPQFAVCTYSSGNNRYEARVTLNENGYAITLYRREDDKATSTKVGTKRVAWKDGEWGADTFSRTLHVDMSGNSISAYFEGEETNKAVYDVSGEKVLTAGSIGLFPMRGSGQDLCLQAF